MELSNGIIFLTGLVLAIAYDDLSRNEVSTQSSTTYSPTDAYRAGNAVDRDITTCMRTNPIGLSTDKTVWWKVDLGWVYNIYSVNILFLNYDGFEMRQRGRFAGFSLFVSKNGSMDSSSLCYKDGPQLPPLNFTTTCITSGRYVIFYNERLDGVTYPEGYELLAYTELCEVIVQECEDGTYGQNCVYICSDNCLNGSPCNRQTGHCDTGCKPGYTNALCNEHCLPGFYGIKCKQRCSGHCLDNLACNHFDGTCSDGCEAGYVDTLCNTSCRHGYYGKNCSYVCSPNCKTCNHTDGLCTCYAGWSRPDCTNACDKSYGENCKFICSSLCFNQKCDPFNGTCLTSCKDNSYGDKCAGCVGSYGEDCQYPCSKHCVNQTCDRLNGRCVSGCDRGYYGPKCDQELVLPRESVLCLSTVASGILGATVSASVFLTTAVVIFFMRRKKLCIFGKNVTSTTDSPYAEIENQPNGESAYQELTVSELNKEYQNLAL
uniref:Protein draper-like n=1 Tax=Crassostrea virginica TaxID=6565 RepID=A0A8B8C923_CRAVI|nr:protein draper-like [Crassostrea virginica]